MTHEVRGEDDYEGHAMVIQARPDRDHVRLTHEHPDGKSSWIEMSTTEVRTLADILCLWLIERSETGEPNV